MNAISQTLFKEMRLNDSLVRDIRRLNPWWEGKSGTKLPPHKRHVVGMIHRRLKARTAPIIAVRGPRQIGKTTAQLHVIEDLLKQGTPPMQILRVSFDELPSLDEKKISEPVLRIVEWYEDVILQNKINDAAHEGKPTYLFFDEVQNLDRWAPQLKFLVDNSTTQVVVTGSSSLRIEQGRDSLAGRISTIEAGVLSLTEIAHFYNSELGKPFLEDNGLDPLTQRAFWEELAIHGQKRQRDRDHVFAKFSARGGYPLAHLRGEVPWPQIADQLNETVVRRVIQHDLRIGERGRKRDEHLLEELFTLSCRYCGQSPDILLFAREVRRALDANIGSGRVQHYLKFLSDALLIRLVKPLEIRLKKKRGANKIVLSDHSLRASWLQEIVPLDPEALRKEPHVTTLAGHIAESATGAALATINGLDIAYLPERQSNPEVDYIITIGTIRIPLELKYQRKIDYLRDTEGLRTFLENKYNNAPFGLLITQTDDVGVEDPRIITMPLSTFLLLR